MPKKCLPRYRALKAIADKFDALGNALSNIGDYQTANNMWAKRSSYNAQAQALRVDTTEEKE